MKNAVITFHREPNYGAVLQSVALQSVLKRYGESYILDYNLKNKLNSKFNLKTIILK